MNERILVVDDEPQITRMIKRVLEQSGQHYEVRTENMSIKAIEVAREFRPHLMLLDVMMPGLLGSEIAAQMKADPELGSIKILFLTALVTKEEELKSTGQIGGQIFLAKPISADELCSVIDEHLRQ